MKKYYYDLHVHSCLSPCADNDSTPCNIAGMARLCGLRIVALTDHNTCKNCPAFFEAAKEHGIAAVAGMELTTSEDIHVICLFRALDDAMRFDEAVNERRIKVKNRADIFGEQLILGPRDCIIGTEEYLLSNATSISIEELPELVELYGGVCYPAHIDRDANGIISVLGTFPETLPFTCYELRDKENKEEYSKKYNLSGKTAIICSDAHYLTDFADGENYFLLDAENEDEEILDKMFELLKQII